MPSKRWQQIDELFQGAVTLVEGARSGFLDAHCPDDSEVRLEVEKLLAAYDRAETFLEPPADGWIGRRLGAYQILKELGQGGMSAVYLARRASEYQSLVAVKRLKPGLASATVRRRLRVERQILARLRHPYIARILDGGTTDESGPYIVMELIEGAPIDAYCDRERLTVRERLALFRRVCEAVQYAHRNLLVHRDLKPTNILVTPEGEPRLLDFGIAKLLAPEEFPENVEDTLTRLRPMTPRYASPEQALGRPITTASDVYSLGVLLYELLAGVAPYSLDGKSATEIETILEHQEPALPSSAVTTVPADGGESAALARGTRPEVLRRVLAGDLDNIALRALRKDPDRRYSSVEQLSDDLRRFLEGLPVRARPSSPAYRLGKLLRRHRTTAAATLAALLLLLGFTAVTVVQAGRIANERDAARREQARAEQVTSLLLDAFREADPSRSRGEQVTAREILDRGARRVEQQLAGEPELQATMLHTLGDVYASLGLYEPAHRFLDRAVEIRRRRFGDSHTTLTESLHARGEVLLEQGDFAAAEADATQALESHRLLAPEKIPLSLDLMGRIRRVQGRRDEAVTLHQQAFDLRRQAGGVAEPELIRGLTYQARAHRAAGDLAGSTEIYRQALALQQAHPAGDHPLLAEILHNLAILLRRQGLLDEAEDACQQAIRINRRLYGDRHLSLARNFNSLSLIRKYQDRPEEAADLLQESLDLKRELLGEDHPRLAISMNNLGALLLHQLNRPAEAEALYREAIDLYRHKLGEDHPNLMPFSIGLGQAVSAAGRPAEAEEILRDVLARAESEQDAKRVAKAQSALGDALSRQRRYGEAESLLLASHAYFLSRSGARVDEARTRARLIRLYRELGRNREASELEVASGQGKPGTGP